MKEHVAWTVLAMSGEERVPLDHRNPYLGIGYWDGIWRCGKSYQERRSLVMLTISVISTGCHGLKADNVLAPRAPLDQVDQTPLDVHVARHLLDAQAGGQTLDMTLEAITTKICSTTSTPILTSSFP